jgi:hypothetical protein
MPDDKKPDQAPDEKMLPQSQVDVIVQDRLARERAKFADYEDLRKFKTEHEKQVEAATQKELEAKKEYERLKEGWTKKEQEYSTIINQKDSTIVNMKVEGSLMTEVTKQNAYAEETLALLKNQAVYDKDGVVRIKGRDANGLEVLDSVEEGVKKFLTNRPHLVRATKKDGGGTLAGGQSAAGGAGQTSDLMTLNNELMQARSRGDHKRAQELTTKIRSALTSQGARV